MSSLILTSRPQASQHSRRRGFTAVEMLIVIAILVLLATMVVLALRALSEPAKANATRATMQVLVNISREGLSTKQSQDLFYGVQQWQITRVAASGEEFFCTAPVQDFSGAATPEAFVQTQKALYLLTKTPKARALFDSISGDLKVKSEGIGDASNNTDNQLVGLKNVNVNTGYVFKTALEGGSDATFNYPFPVYSATDLRDAHISLWVKIPLIVDSWGNPILYVPDGYVDNNQTDGKWPDSSSNPTSNASNSLANTRGGLIRVKSEATQQWWNVGGNGAPAGYTQASIPTPQTGDGNAVILFEAIRAPDRRPFWVSAGPDGKYETHDDNIYSFID